MNQIGRIAGGDAALPGNRDLGPSTPDGGEGKFQSIFEQLGAESSQTDSASAQGADEGGAASHGPVSPRARFISVFERFAAGSSQTDSGAEEAIRPQIQVGSGKVADTEAIGDSSQLPGDSEPASGDATDARGKSRVRVAHGGHHRDQPSDASAPPDGGASVEVDATPPILPPAVPSTGSPVSTGEGMKEPPGPARSNQILSSDESGAVVGLRVTVKVLGEETHFGPLRGKGGDPTVQVRADGEADEADSVPQADTATAEPPPARVKARAEADKSPGLAAKADETAVPVLGAARSEGPAASPVSSMPGGTVQRIADAVLGAASELESPASTPAAAGPGAQLPVRVLHVRLDPPEYGAVTVRMTLHGTALSLQIRADRETTAEALRHDKEKLADVLRADGYDTDVTLIDTRRDMTAARIDPASMSKAGGGGDAGALADQSRGDSRSASRDPRDGGSDTSPYSLEGKPDGSPVPDPRAGALYV